MNIAFLAEIQNFPILYLLFSFNYFFLVSKFAGYGLWVHTLNNIFHIVVIGFSCWGRIDPNDTYLSIPIAVRIAITAI